MWFHANGLKSSSELNLSHHTNRQINWFLVQITCDLFHLRFLDGKYIRSANFDVFSTLTERHDTFQSQTKCQLNKKNIIFTDYLSINENDSVN